MKNKLKKIIRTKKLSATSYQLQARSCGFTIIETLISLTLFSIAITGVITVAAKGGINTNMAKNRLVGTYLADEGIELMRGMRDTVVLNEVSLHGHLYSDGWAQFLTTINNCGSTSFPFCDIDGANIAGIYPYPQIGNMTPCTTPTTIPGLTGNYCPLFYDTVTGLYNDRGVGTRTPFSRALSAVSIDAPNEVQVKSTVVWQEGAGGQSITQTENLFDWYSS